MDTPIVTQLADRILRIEIRRPERKNALTVPMYAAMADALRAASADPAVRAVLLHGQPGIFTSGNDIADFMSAATDFAEDRPVFQFLQAISTSQKPVVAAVTGPAIGIGTTMLLHCDLVYAGASARFQLPFVNLALVPEAASTLLLPAAIGYPRAAALLLLGEAFPAAKAHEYGLITDVVADDEVMGIARSAALALAAKPPGALRTTRMLMKQALAQPIAEQMREEARHFAAARGSAEAAEAFQAFFEKRKADFSRFD
jgi:enoyl-CoA hydratase/carnithine racemase